MNGFIIHGSWPYFGVTDNISLSLQAFLIEQTHKLEFLFNRKSWIFNMRKLGILNM